MTNDNLHHKNRMTDREVLVTKAQVKGSMSGGFCAEIGRNQSCVIISYFRLSLPSGTAKLNLCL